MNPNQENKKELILRKAYEELKHYMSWMIENYPEAHYRYMTTCPECKKRFKENKGIWKPNCKHLNKDYRLSI